MVRRTSDVTDAELAVLQVLWDEGPSPIRRLTEILYAEAGPSNYATVQKLLERLESKGYVARRRDTGAHVFSADVERSEIIDLRLRDVAQKLCGGSVAPLLTQLVRGSSLSASDRKMLKDLVAGLDAKRTDGRAKRREEPS